MNVPDVVQFAGLFVVYVAIAYVMSRYRIRRSDKAIEHNERIIEDLEDKLHLSPYWRWANRFDRLPRDKR